MTTSRDFIKTLKKVLMHEDEEVCVLSFDERYNLVDIDSIINPNIMPLGYHSKDDGSDNISFIKSWWKNNEIPTERDSVRLGLECLGIDSVEELHLLGRGLSLGNHFWLKDEDEDISWSDVNFWENPFSDDVGEALFNHKKRNSDMIPYSPDVSLNGLLKKRWIYRRDGYYLEKGGSGILKQEVYNEWLISRIFELSGIPAIHYDIVETEGVRSVCPAFTSEKKEFIPYSQIFESIPRIAYPGESELEYFYRTLDHYEVDYSREQINTMLAVDYITVNTDRHYNNIGILLDSDGSKRLAPIFDNGTSLWCLSSTDDIDIDDDIIMARPFCDKTTIGYWSRQIKLITHMPDIDRDRLIALLESFKELASMNSDFSEKRVNIIAKGILHRYDKLSEIIKKV